MIRKFKKIQVFEHQTLYIGRDYDSVFFEEKHFVALAKLNEYHKNKYFTVVHKGIKFSQYVGVVQIDDLCIEILPKSDSSTDDKKVWQGALIEMLKVTKKLNLDNVGQANVNKQSIHLLDIYFEWFLNELQLLIRQGLIKKYYKEKRNIKVLKGKLEFAEHISKNLIHKERFFTSHQVYEKDHLIHQILGQALNIVDQMSNGSYLYSKCKSINLDFPEVKKIRATVTTFNTLPKNRKTAPYKTALEIARLIILNYAPNITSGKENMLALLFDMNSLWEEYVLVKLKQAATDGTLVFGQSVKVFWNGITIRPDIVIQNGIDTYIIDTKWKNINGNKPSTDDLRQMYVYNEYWKSTKAVLLYPSNYSDYPRFKNFEGISENEEHHQCGLGKISIFDKDNNKLNNLIGKEIINWFV
jgi:5-methylcytosine-specific restriction enzyme subunit McrC